MNAYANYVVGHLLAQSWHIALLAGTVGLISLARRNRSAHLRYLLWLIVLAKCLAPPVVTVPLAVLPERPWTPPVGLVDFPEEHSAFETPAFPGKDPKPPESIRAIPDVREVVALAWTAGVGLFLLWVGCRAIRYTSWLRERRKTLSPDLWASIKDSSLGFHFRKWPRIWLLDDIHQPFVWGLFRGCVYLPTDFAAWSGSDRQRNILAHELSHIARFDAGVNLLQVLAQAVYWFHPFVWWANRRIRQEREKCCDEMAVARLHTPPEHYTGAIVDALAAEHHSSHPIPSLAIVGSIRDIEERIKTMLKPGKTFRTRPTLVAAAIVLLIALVTLPTALVLTARGQTPPTQTSDKPVLDSEKPDRRFPRMISVLVDKSATDSETSDQPRYAARTFNSKMAFEVRVNQELAGSYRGLFGTSIGSTPSDTPLEIPACPLWHVRPATPVEDWGLLIREIERNEIPGLGLAAVMDSDLRYLASLSGLEFLDLTEAPITDAGLVHLKGLTGLWGLNLRGTKVTGSGLEQLKDLTGLEFLDLMGTPVSDAGLQHLKKLKGLRRVNLWGTGVTDAGLVHLKDVTGLQTINLNDTKITGAGLESLKGMSGLRGLAARWTQINDADLVHLEGMTELRSLDFIGVGITNLGLEHLKDLTKLQQLNLNRTKVTDSGLASLAGLTELTGLWLAYTPLTDAGLAHFAHLTKLRQLGLLETQVTDATVIDLISKQSELQQLGLAGTRITDSGLLHLKGLRQLWLLNLDGTPITDAGLAHLKGLTGLKELGLNASKVTDAGLVHIEGLTRLQILRLAETGITDAGLEHLKGLTNLRYLYLSGTQVTGAAVQRLQQSLPNLTCMRGQAQATGRNTDRTTASTSEAATGDEMPKQPRFASRTFNAKTPFAVHVDEISGASGKLIGSTPSAAPLEIPACRNWYVLPSPPVQDWDLLVREMSENKVPGLKLNRATDSEARHLADLTGLQWLWLQDAEITDVGLESLKTLTELRDLVLTDNRVTDVGLAHLLNLTKLQTLALTGCRITDLGLASLETLQDLEGLLLSGVCTTDAGMASFQRLPKLRGLCVTRNQRITDAGVVHVESLLGLETLDLHETAITDAGLSHLRGLTQLKQLWLQGTKITDLGLQDLKGLTGLEVLMLSNTQVTDTGVQQLRQSLPKLTIIR